MSNNGHKDYRCLIVWRHHGHKHFKWKTFHEKVTSWHGGKVLICIPIRHRDHHHGGGWCWHGWWNHDSWWHRS